MNSSPQGSPYFVCLSLLIPSIVDMYTHYMACGYRLRICVRDWAWWCLPHTPALHTCITPVPTLPPPASSFPLQMPDSPSHYPQ